MRYNRHHLVLFLVATIASGCFDHRRAVAFATLATPDGRFDKAAYLAALRARFPDGTQATALTDYVAAARGECHTTEDVLSCKIPLRGFPCAAEIILIKAAGHDGTIRDLDALVGGLGC